MLRNPSMQGRFRSAVDALDLVPAVVDDDPHTSTIVFVDRRPPDDGLVIPITGELDRAGIEQLDRVVLEGMDSEPGARFVIVSLRTTGSAWPSSEDVELWRRLQAQHDEASVPLLDWFIVAGDQAFSIAGGHFVGSRGGMANG